MPITSETSWLRRLTDQCRAFDSALVRLMVLLALAGSAIVPALDVQPLARAMSILSTLALTLLAGLYLFRRPRKSAQSASVPNRTAT
jgi:hypothetical protein